MLINRSVCLLLNKNYSSFFQVNINLGFGKTVLSLPESIENFSQDTVNYRMLIEFLMQNGIIFFILPYISILTIYTNGI